MLRIDGIKCTPDAPQEALYARCARILHTAPKNILSLTLLRRSVDARDGLQLVYSVAAALTDEDAVLRRCRRKNVSRYVPETYALPPAVQCPLPPVVVGAGPAGLFAAFVLASCGMRPILLERGRPVEQRAKDVEHFFRSGILDPESNVQFGEGGAGAFSDGKLNTGTKDLRHRFILEQLAACGAPDTILYDAKPHVGTDKLHIALLNLRKKLLDADADIRFGHKLAGLETENGVLTAIRVSGPDGAYSLPCRQLVLALGHSARDTVEALYDQGLHMEQKPFAMGVRIEHRQADIDAVQYGEYAGHPALGAAAYKLACHTSGGRGVFSFCVCPGGEVVAAASEVGRVATNGMSEYARAKENINGALLVSTTPEDFPGSHPLAGIELQRQLETASYALAGGGYLAPCQRVEDFLLHRPSAGCGKVHPSYRPGVIYTDLHRCLPRYITDALEEALPVLGRKLPGYDDPDALLTAVESRSSAPVRIPRDEQYQANIRGIYPCGEGAGYAGGILSAAADGMRCAEKIVEEWL